MLGIIKNIKDKIAETNKKLQEKIENECIYDEEQRNLYKEIILLYSKIEHTKSMKEKKKLYEDIIELIDTIDFEYFRKNLLNSSIKENSLYSTTDFGLWFHRESLNDYIYGIFEKIKKNKDKNLNLLKKAISFENEVNSIPKHKIILSQGKVQKKLLQDLNDIPIAKIGKNFNKEKLFKYIIIDIETTGLQASRNKIIEISAIKYIDFEPIECFTTLINPECEITNNITSINNINNDMVKNMPTINQVIKDFDKFIDGFNLVGYNICFDLKFLYCNGSNILENKIKIYDVYELAKKVFKNEPSDYKLETICNQMCDLYLDTNHRSLIDCYATNIVFNKCIEEIIDN